MEDRRISATLTRVGAVSLRGGAGTAEKQTGVKSGEVSRAAKWSRMLRNAERGGSDKMHRRTV